MLPVAEAEVLASQATPIVRQTAAAHHMLAAQGVRAQLPEQHAAGLQQVAAPQQVCAPVAWSVS